MGKNRALHLCALLLTSLLVVSAMHVVPAEAGVKHRPLPSGSRCLPSPGVRSCSRHRLQISKAKMASFHRRHLVIFEETEVNYSNAPSSGLIVLVKPESPHAHIDINPVEIQLAIQQQTDVYVTQDLILRYHSDYVVLTGLFETTNKILGAEFLRVGVHYLAIFPLTLRYGSIEVPIDPAIPSSTLQPTAPQDTRNYQLQEPLKLTVIRVPLIFWGPHDLVPRIFRNICDVCDVHYRSSDLAFSMVTYASRSTIPNMASMGIHRAVASSGHVMNIWTIWIHVTPVEPGDLQRVQANAERPNQRIRYTIYPQQNGDEGAGHSGGGALEAGRQQPGYFVEAPVDSSNDGSNETSTELKTSDTVVEETPSPEITSCLNIEAYILLNFNPYINPKMRRRWKGQVLRKSTPETPSSEMLPWAWPS